MPATWIITMTDALGLEPFPDTPLAFYLARHLSLLYGCVGVILLVVSCDVPRFRDLIGWLAIGVVALGFIQGVVDYQCGMPIWWTLGESISTVVGGALMYWLHVQCEDEHDSDTATENAQSRNT